MRDEQAGDPYAREAVAAMRARPGFRRAVEASARGVLDLYLTVDTDMRWVFRDRGRFFIGATLVMLHRQGLLTAASLKNAVADLLREASAGRVRAFLQRTMGCGLVTVARDATGKPMRALIPANDFLRNYQLHRLAIAAAFAKLDPAMEAMCNAIAGPDYPAVEMFLSTAMMQRPDIFADVPREAVFTFFSREAGFTILFDLMLSQPARRNSLLERAPVTVHGLAQRHSVSRAHVLRLLTDAEESGWLTFDREKREIRFAAKFSDRFERHSAMHFLLYKEAWRQYRAAQPR
jgi:hypothetical protein